MEFFKVLLFCIVSAFAGGLISFFISVTSQRNYFKREIEAGVKIHQPVCEQRFISGNERFERQSTRLSVIEQKLDKTHYCVVWIVGRMKGDPQEIYKEFGS